MIFLPVAKFSCAGATPVTRCWFYLQQSSGVQTYGFFRLRSDFGSKHMETSESVLVSKLLFIVLSSKCAWSPVMAWCRRKWSQVNWKVAYVSMFRFWYVAATLFTLLVLLQSSTQFLGLALIFGPQHLKSFGKLKQTYQPIAISCFIFPFSSWYSHSRWYVLVAGLWKSELRRFVDWLYVWSPLVETW